VLAATVEEEAHQSYMESPIIGIRTSAKLRLQLPSAKQEVHGSTTFDYKGTEVENHASIEIYQRLGVRPFINARGTWTYLSGSLALPEVRHAMDCAARHFVDVFELQQAAGRRLAELSGAEAGMVTSGAAAAMATAAAACMAGTDHEKIWQLPDTTGMKDQVIMLGGRIPFDSALRLTGAKLVVVMELEELEAAIGNETAMIYTCWVGERLEKAVAIAKKAGVVLMLDDAAGIPPFENLSRYADMGLDLYCFSGGKGLRGPQSSGVLLGRRDLIEAALAQSTPWEGAVCRPMKVGKEEIIGVLTAIETWAKLDLNELNREWLEKVESIAKRVESVPGVTTEITIPDGANRYPTLAILWDEQAFGLTVADCDRLLRDGEPRIEVLTSSNPSLVTAVLYETLQETEKTAGTPEDKLRLVSMTLQPGEDLIVGNRLCEILNSARTPHPHDRAS